jgi:hypothetical protein
MKVRFAVAPLSDSSAANAANSATEPRLTFQYWNYYPTFNGKSDNTESGTGRILIPFKVDGIQQIFHIIPTVASDPDATSGPRTGFGGLQFYNLSVANFDRLWCKDRKQGIFDDLATLG